MPNVPSSNDLHIYELSCLGLCWRCLDNALSELRTARTTIRYLHEQDAPGVEELRESVEALRETMRKTRDSINRIERQIHGW